MELLESSVCILIYICTLSKMGLSCGEIWGDEDDGREFLFSQAFLKNFFVKHFLLL